MKINLIDARRGLYDKCLELFADKNIAEQIYRYLCDGIEDCEEAEPNSCEYWDSESRFCALRRPQAEPVKHGRWIGIGDFPHETWECDVCGYIVVEQCDMDEFKYCPNCGAKMDLGEVEE